MRSWCTRWSSLLVTEDNSHLLIIKTTWSVPTTNGSSFWKYLQSFRLSCLVIWCRAPLCTHESRQNCPFSKCRWPEIMPQLGLADHTHVDIVEFGRCMAGSIYFPVCIPFCTSPCCNSSASSQCNKPNCSIQDNHQGLTKSQTWGLLSRTYTTAYSLPPRISVLITWFNVKTPIQSGILQHSSRKQQVRFFNMCSAFLVTGILEFWHHGAFSNNNKMWPTTSSMTTRSQRKIELSI